MTDETKLADLERAVGRHIILRLQMARDSLHLAEQCLTDLRRSGTVGNGVRLSVERAASLLEEAEGACIVAAQKAHETYMVGA